MGQGVWVVGTNHEIADLASRGSLSLSSEKISNLTRELKQAPESEFLAISTCNRTEIYGVGLDQEAALVAWAKVTGRNREEIDQVLYCKDATDAIRHLFLVAAGLNSAALGESEILGQLKSAYADAERLGSLGKILRPLFQRAFRVSKRVRSESELGRYGLSLASVGVRRAGPLKSKQILIVGAGQIAESVAKNLAHQDCRNVTVCSRTLSRAFTLAAMHGFNALSGQHLDKAIGDSDIVFCAASVAQPILDTSSPLKPGAYIVDFGVPPNVSRDLRMNGSVKVVDMDDLLQEVHQNMAHVKSAVPKATALVDEEVEIYSDECREREASPSIAALVQRMEEIRKHNLNWALSQIPVENSKERKLVEDLSIRLTRGMLNEPIAKLKSGFRDPAERAVLARFFQAES